MNWRVFLSRWLFFILLVQLSVTPAYSTDSIALPDMGDPSSADITPDEELRLGENLMRWLRHNDLIVMDPLIQSYTHSLGYQLVANSDNSAESFTFFVVKDPSINAFAAPGGFIGVHTGLILTTEAESELAAVLAHEVAHITQKHMARTYESAKKQQLTTAVALLAAILIGQNVDQLTEAAIATSVAANAQLQINFTRANEQEADYIGISTLANAGFDPQGMPSFFERMQKASKLYGTALPEFLSTHPVTVNRIAESRNRAREIKVKPLKSNTLYPFIKARIEVQKATDILQFIRDHKRTEKAVNNKAAYQYALAIAYQKAGQPDKAMTAISPLVKSDPESILYRIAEAEIQQALGMDKRARENFRTLLNLYPYSYAITVHYARNLLLSGQNSLAYSLLQDYRRNRDSDILILDLLSKAASNTGKTAEAYLYLAEHDFLNGDTRTAISHLKTAASIKGIDYYLSSQIDAKLKEYKQIALLEK
jgi:predicted Zn-dependent protease